MVYLGTDETTGKQRYVQRTVRAPNNRAGAKQADLALAQFVTEVHQGRVDPTSNLTFGEYLDVWIGTRAHLSPKTLVDYRGHIRRRIKPALGEIRLHRLRGHHLQTFYAAQTKTVTVEGRRVEVPVSGATRLSCTPSAMPRSVRPCGVT